MLTTVPPLVVHVVPAAALDAENTIAVTATEPKPRFRRKRFMLVLGRCKS